MTDDEKDALIRAHWKQIASLRPQWHSDTVFIGAWVRAAFDAGAEYSEVAFAAELQNGSIQVYKP